MDNQRRIEMTREAIKNGKVSFIEFDKSLDYSAFRMEDSCELLTFLYLWISVYNALEDILEDEVDKKYYLSEKSLEALRRHLERNREKGNGFGMDIKGAEQKSSAVIVGEKGVYDLITVRQLNPSESLPPSPSLKRVEDVRITDRGLYPCRHDKGKLSGISELGTITFPSAKSDTVVTSNVPHVCLSTARLAKNLRSRGGKTLTLLASIYKGEQANGMSLVEDGFSVRRLTPAECARLQTTPDWYEWRCSETQRYRMLGNGWTVEVIKHILSFINI